METAPFTKEYAFELAWKFQPLIGKQYTHRNITFTVSMIAILPYNKEDREKFEFTYSSMYNDVGYSIADIVKQLSVYEVNEFEVEILGISEINGWKDIDYKPMDLTSRGHFFDYYFNI